MNEYDDRDDWNNEDLIGRYLCLVRCDDKEKDKLLAAILKRMSAAPQDDEWDEVTLGDNELLQKGDMFHWSLIGRPDQEVYESNIGRRVGEFGCPKITRRVPKTKPVDDEWEERELHNEIMQEGDIFRYTGGDEPLLPLWFGKNSNELYFAKIIRRVRKEKPQPEKPKVRFAIAGTKDADLPGVVVLELVIDGYDITLHCKDYEYGHLLSINKFTGKAKRENCVNRTIDLPLDDQGRLVIE